jgi:hypothetical protein
MSDYDLNVYCTVCGLIAYGESSLITPKSIHYTNTEIDFNKQITYKNEKVYSCPNCNTGHLIFLDNNIIFTETRKPLPRYNNLSLHTTLNQQLLDDDVAYLYRLLGYFTYLSKFIVYDLITD